MNGVDRPGKPPRNSEPPHALLRFTWAAGQRHLELHLLTIDGTIACKAQAVSAGDALVIADRFIPRARTSRWYLRLCALGDGPVERLTVALEYRAGATQRTVSICDDQFIASGETGVIELDLDVSDEG